MFSCQLVPSMATSLIGNLKSVFCMFTSPLCRDSCAPTPQTLCWKGCSFGGVSSWLDKPSSKDSLDDHACVLRITYAVKSFVELRLKWLSISLCLTTNRYQFDVFDSSEDFWVISSTYVSKTNRQKRKKKVQASLATLVQRKQSLQYTLGLRCCLSLVVSTKLYVLWMGYLVSMIAHAKLH